MFRRACARPSPEEGLIRARPIGLLETTEEAEVWFATGEDNTLVSDIQRDPRVSLALQESGAYLSLSGMAERITDQEKLDELWKPELRRWFPKGKESDRVTLIKLVPFEGEFWDISGLNRVKFFFEQIKAALLGEQPDTSQMNERMSL